MAHYPADTFQEATEIAIEASNQLHGVINGDANAEVTVEDGSKIPSVRKAMVDSLYFKPPIAWAQGEYEDTYNQLREFVDGDVRTWWFAKGATVSTPVLMTTNPATDPNWTLWSAVTLNAATYETQKRLAAEAGLNMVGSFLLGATVTTTIDVVFYESDGKYYSWSGSFPKVASAGSTPASTGGVGAGAWVDRTQDTLRNDLSNPDSQTSIAGVNASLLVKNATRPRTFYDHGAVGDGIADDTTAVLAAIAFVKANRGYRLAQVGGKFKYSTTLPFNDCSNVFSSTDEPQHFSMQCEMIYTGTDKAVNQTGNGWGYSVYIETLTGSGVIAEGVAGSGAENIGLYIGPNSGCTAKVGTITNFNINTLFDGAYFNKAEVDYSFRCLYAIKFRNHPTFGYVSNANTYIGKLAGGPYVASGLTSDNNAKYGLHIMGGQSNIINVGGIEYSVRTTDGVNIYLDATSMNNVVTCHTEGSLQRNVIDYGQGNILTVDGVTSQSLTGVSVEISGIGGKFGPIPKQSTQSQVTGFAPHQGQGDLRISPACEVIGPVVMQDAPAGAHTANNIVESSPPTSAFVRSDGVNTYVGAGTNYPLEVNATPNELTYTITSSTDNTTWFTVGPYSLGGITQSDAMFSAYIRGAVNNLKVSIFILDQSGVFLDSINTEFRGSTAWRRIKFPVKLGTATGIYYRIALRGFDGVNGGTIEFFRPKITFDVASELHHSAGLGLPNKQTIKGNLLGEPTNKMFADINRVETQQIVSTAFPVNGRDLIVFSNPSGGNTINAFTSVIDGQEFTVVNISGVSLNISMSAMKIGAGLTIANSYSMRFFKYAGNVYPVRT